jgi:O-acetyl-ADP-ribose deacetylase (regulator of RNase III)
MPIVKQIKGDLIELFKQNQFPTIAHGCNCMQLMGAGIAAQISSEFPEAIEADKNFPLPSLYRLGEYSIVPTQHGVILNFYTQLKPGANFEYSALRSCLKRLSMEAIAQGTYLQLAVPYIGAGIGGGDWEIIRKILNSQEHLLITVVEYDKGALPVGEEKADGSSES